MRLRCVAVLIIGLLLHTSCANRQRYTVTTQDLAGFSSTELDFTFGEQQEFSRNPFVTVTIQGQVFRLMFDTGAESATISLSPSALERIQVDFMKDTVHYNDAEGNEYRARKYIIPEVVLGSLSLTNVPADENLNARGEFDGYAGLELFRNFNVLFDYASQTITLYRNDITPEYIQQDGWHRTSFHDKLSIDIQPSFLEDAYSVIIDTGSGYFVMPRQSDLAEKTIRHFGSMAGESRTNDRTGLDVMLFTFDQVYLNGYDIGEQDVVIMDLGNYLGNGILGYNLFKNNQVFINFASKEMWLKRN